MDMNEVVSNRIKKARKACKLNQQDFADKVGVSLMTVKRWENPKINRTPYVSKLTSIAKVLNTSEEYLLGLTNDVAIVDLPHQQQMQRRQTKK